MKSRVIKSLALSLITLTLWSCKKDETQTVSNVSPAGTLSASATTLSLVQANGALPALTLSYPLSTSTGYVVPVGSTLEFGLKGKNFSPSKEVVVTKTTYAPTISELNATILAVGGEVAKPAQLEVRLKSGAAANAMTYSNVVTISATPYLASAWVYVPGAYQDWKPETADSLISLSSNGIYTGMINFLAGKLIFKVTPAKSWAVAYGDGGAGKINSAATADNITSPKIGVQQVTVNMNTSTIAFSTPNEWSIVGSATAGGWDVDTDLKGVNDGKYNNYSIQTNLTVGVFKFRFQHKWDTNLGGNISALTGGGADIAISTAGTYTITLDVAAKKATLVKN